MRRVIRVLTIPVLCAVAGFVLAHDGTTSRTTSPPPPLSGQATAADFAIRYPTGWTVHPAGAVLQGALRGSLLLAPGGAGSASASSAFGSTLAVGVARPARPGTLSGPVRALLATVPTQQVIALGGADFVRFPGATPRIGTGSDWIYLLPTTRGTITAICAAGRMTNDIAGGCERMLATLRLSHGESLSVVADAGYGLAVNRVLTSLDRVRRRDGDRLRAVDPRLRATAAAALAAADGRAAHELAHLSGIRVSIANAGLVSALDRGRRAYGDLAAATTARDSARYVAAEGEVGRAERALSRAFTRLHELGYRLA